MPDRATATVQALQPAPNLSATASPTRSWCVIRKSREGDGVNPPLTGASLGRESLRHFISWHGTISGSPPLREARPNDAVWSGCATAGTLASLRRGLLYLGRTSFAISRPHVIRRKLGLPSWLTRENPITWGPREEALPYASEHEARQRVAILELNATVTVELASERN